MHSPSSEEIDQAGEIAVSAFLNYLHCDLGTGRFILIIEGIDAAGERGLYLSTPKNQTTWDTLGMLVYAQSAGEMDIGPE